MRVRRAGQVFLRLTGSLSHAGGPLAQSEFKSESAALPAAPSQSAGPAPKLREKNLHLCLFNQNRLVWPAEVLHIASPVIQGFLN